MRLTISSSSPSIKLIMSTFSWENFLGHLFAKCFGLPQMKQKHFVWEGFLTWWGLDLCPFLYEMLSWMNFLLLRVLLLKYFWEFLFLFACFWVLERFLYFFFAFYRLSIFLWSVYNLFTKAKVLIFECSLNLCLSTFFSNYHICIYNSRAYY